ncbi:hypothetical protein Y032_0089g2228 [Ancylostoma ceylanicum]|uniref:Secreted protein n=1 Tax=Ancylostoma ceylanicum TaxID=53326 RepID=A0A016TN10_9BILA|nr:hypothetical protein Y032_0089g2228 [Ancylostoma ceylanicum]
MIAFSLHCFEVKYILALLFFVAARHLKRTVSREEHGWQTKVNSIGGIQLRLGLHFTTMMLQRLYSRDLF